MGATYEPQELVATQVVAGTNYKFLANGTKTTNPITKGTYYITIYKNLQGNIELKDIEVIEEKQEQVKEEVNKQDITQMSFWVVFYDQYGNELQREALKYGTVPEYKTWLPEGFDKWVYKNTGKDVGSFKSITGNTYYQAVCHEVYHSSNDPTPVPTPTPVSATLTMENGIGTDDWNKFTITIKGTDIVAGRYYFASSTIVNEADNLEELVQSEGVTLTDEQIQSINSAGGLNIIKEDLAEGTYKTVLVVSNSDGNSKTIVVEGDTGEAPPPM